MIKAIIFDCFGVLTGDKWKEFVGTLEEEQREPARELNRALDRGQLSLKDFSQAVHKLTGRLPERVEQVINAELSKNEGLIKYIRQLKKHYKIGLLSNISTNWITEEFLSKDEVDLFDAIILSHQIGVTKPMPAIYHAAADKLEVSPEQCVIIDDGPANCQGAREVGMHAILYEDFLGMKRELETILANSDN